MAPPTVQIPSALPPSVEESYRQKCIQLRQRMAEVQEANDASRIRLDRMKRWIEKMRLERAFLLEHLAKRTSTNVEDSDGSPSPPPSPQGKPLRTKRGHRKPSFLANLDSTRNSAFISHTQTLTQSPTNSDAFSHGQLAGSRPVTAVANGTHNPAASEQYRRLRNGFELFASEARSPLMMANKQRIKEGKFDVEKTLAMRWQSLGPEGQNEYQSRYESGEYNGGLEAGRKSREIKEEDVEMEEVEDEDES